jgi:hypothetical protein
MELVSQSVPRLHSVDDEMINECGAVDVMRTGKGNRSTQRKSSLQCHFAHHKFYVIGLNSGLCSWKPATDSLSYSTSFWV